MTEPALTLGIEDEYLLVDPVSRDLVPDPPPELVEALEHRHEGAVAREFFRCQVEVGTPVCRSIAEARVELTRLRRSVVEEAERHGLALIAASTHPFGTWRPQKHTDRSRYDQQVFFLDAEGQRGFGHATACRGWYRSWSARIGANSSAIRSAQASAAASAAIRSCRISISTCGRPRAVPWR